PLGEVFFGDQGDAQHGRAVGLGADVGQDVGAEEDARQGVVVFGGDGVELVVVTASAGDGQAQEGPADHVNLVIDNVGEQLFLVGVAAAPVADGQQAGGDDAVGVDGPLLLCRQQIAGDLVEDELVVG